MNVQYPFDYISLATHLTKILRTYNSLSMGVGNSDETIATMSVLFKNYPELKTITFDESNSKVPTNNYGQNQVINKYELTIFNLPEKCINGSNALHLIASGLKNSKFFNAGFIKKLILLSISLDEKNSCGQTAGELFRKNGLMPLLN